MAEIYHMLPITLEAVNLASFVTGVDFIDLKTTDTIVLRRVMFRIIPYAHQCV